jgi:hypothetical protein
MKERSNNGNAYGKNKNGLEGREFGQARAAEAKAQIDIRERELKESEVKIADSRNRLLTIVKRFEKDRDTKKITQEEYVLRRQKIKNAEDILDKSERSLVRNRKVLSEQRIRLSSLFEN